MDPTFVINERVEVVALYRKNCEIAELCLPHKMRWRGREVIFTELGLRHPTRSGKRMVHVFDVSDGAVDYRLEFDAESLTWTLASTVEVS